jgi:hypothetical protein
MLELQRFRHLLKPDILMIYALRFTSNPEVYQENPTVPAPIDQPNGRG